MICLMLLVVQNSDGVSIAATTDFSIDLQYGGSKSDFVLEVRGMFLEKHSRILIDGTAFAGIVDKRCPASTADGDYISYKGRTIQGVLTEKVIMPPAGASHLIVSGDANDVIQAVVEQIGLSDYLRVPSGNSGFMLPDYKFYRFIDAYSGLRMALASVGARLKITASDGRHIIEAVGRKTYGEVESERAFFDVEIDDLPINHLIGLGKGEGTSRAISHCYADILGNVSMTQTLFGVNERVLTYSLNSEEADTLADKTRSKLIEYQEASEASLSLPLGVDLDVGDLVHLSNAKYGLDVTTGIVEVVLKASLGLSEVSYKFGSPDFPEEEE